MTKRDSDGQVPEVPLHQDQWTCLRAKYAGRRTFAVYVHQVRLPEEAAVQGRLGRSKGAVVVATTLEWVKQRTWAKVIVTVLVVVTLPIWLPLVAVLAPFVIAYSEMWEERPDRRSVDG